MWHLLQNQWPVQLVRSFKYDQARIIHLGHLPLLVHLSNWWQKKNGSWSPPALSGRLLLRLSLSLQEFAPLQRHHSMPAAVSSEAVASAPTPVEAASWEAVPAQAGTSCQPAGLRAEGPATGPLGDAPPAWQSQRPWQAAPPVQVMRRVASDAYTAMRQPDLSGRAQNPLRRRHLAAPALQQRAQQWVAGESVSLKRSPVVL